MNKYILLLVFPVIIIACNQFGNKAIYLPEINDLYVLGKPVPSNTFYKKAKVKIVTYYEIKDFDPDLQWLQPFPKALKKYENNPNVKFYFYLYSSDYAELTKRLIKIDFHYPVIYDKENIYFKKNIKQPGVAAVTFIVDQNNNFIKRSQPLLAGFDSIVEKLIAE